MTEKGRDKIQIEQKDSTILQKILIKYPYKFYVYGSRARGYASKYSDIDILCKEKIKSEDLVDIKTQLEESSITIKVDVIDAGNCSEEFISSIEQDLIELT